MNEISDEIERHAFGSFVPNDASILIIGTFPTIKKNWSFNFFYTNKRNQFWKLISDIYVHKWEYLEGGAATKERKELLSINRIAITDMIEEGIRRDNNASDRNLKPK